MGNLHNKQNFADHPNNCQINNCRSKSVRILIYTGIFGILAFIFGFIVNPVLLRNIWLITLGTIVVICGIAICILYARINTNGEDFFCIQNQIIDKSDKHHENSKK